LDHRGGRGIDRVGQIAGRDDRGKVGRALGFSAVGEDRAEIDCERRAADDERHQAGADDGEVAAFIGIEAS